MCGRYVVNTPPQQLALEFGADLQIQEYPPDYNVAPTKPVPAVLVRHDRRTLSTLRWGLIPFWAKDPSIGARMINARIESAAEKPAFRQSLARRRCLLPADGYYEWLTVAPAASAAADGPGTKPAKPRKQPYYLRRADGAPLAFAGLYERWRDAEGNELWSASILTAPAADPIAWLHDRMPLTVPREAWSAWLDPGQTDPSQVRDLLDYTPDWIAAAVGEQVGSVRNNGPGLIEPLPTDRPKSGMGDVAALF